MTTAPKKNEQLAIASLVLGILSLICSIGLICFGGMFYSSPTTISLICIMSPVLCIPAVVCGHEAKTRIKKNPEILKGNGLAVVGLITGYIILTVILATVMQPAKTPAREDARRAACKSNLHQMQLKLEMYADAHSGIYPPDIMTFKKFLADSGTVTNINRLFSCPSSGKNDGNDYTMAPDLKAGDPKTKDAFWDTSIDNHGKKGRNVITLDGTITFRKP